MKFLMTVCCATCLKASVDPMGGSKIGVYSLSMGKVGAR
jgi:hypothetical protein